MDSNDSSIDVNGVVGSSNKALERLRDEYEQHIKTLKLENQVKVLELEKQVSNQEVVIQKLKHEAEMAKIKIEQEQKDLESRRTMAHCERDKEESEKQLKILALQKENEALRHELELTILKSEADLKETHLKLNEECQQKMDLEKENEILKQRVKSINESEKLLLNNDVACQTEEKCQENQNLNPILVKESVSKANETICQTQENYKGNQQLIRWDNQNLNNETTTVSKQITTNYPIMIQCLRN